MSNEYIKHCFDVGFLHRLPEPKTEEELKRMRIKGKIKYRKSEIERLKKEIKELKKELNNKQV